MGNKTSGVIDKTPVRTPNLIHVVIQDRPDSGYRYCDGERVKVTSIHAKRQASARRVVHGVSNEDGRSMVGVVGYARECKVCRHPEESRITAALLARQGTFALTKRHDGLQLRDIRQHSAECLGIKRARRSK
jgi:hypothetical protein